MSFFDRLFNWIRGINEKNRPVVAAQQITPADFVFGTIVSGGYTNFKHDPTPTILCLGNYIHSNGRSYVHGIQLHEISSFDLTWLMGLVNNMKQNNTSTNPRAFYNYLKLNRPSIINSGYRWYHTELTSFKTINPGFSYISENLCVEPTDIRDSFLKQKKETPIDKEKLQQSINDIINTRKVF